MKNYERLYRFEEVLNRFNHLAMNGSFVFRGYGKQDELLPNIIRDKKSYVKIEKKLLEDFEKYGSNYYHATTPIDFMSYAQHYGIPTRLLDFTYNPYIALSFSLYNPKSSNYKYADDKEYYYVRYASLKENLIEYTIALSEDIYNNSLTRTDSLGAKTGKYIDNISNLFDVNIEHGRNTAIGSLKDVEKMKKIRNRTILFIDSNQSNQRIIMQQGLFMFPYILDEKEHLEILEKNSKCIMIHKDLRNELLRYLDTLGYNAFRLMPDLTSICEAIKRRNMDSL